MISALISLVVSLAVLYVVYLLVEWILGFIAIVPSVFKTIVYIVFCVLAFIIVLNFLGSLLGSGGFRFLK